MELTPFFKKYIEPYMVIAVVILLLTLAVLLYQDNQLKKEISQNCGWGEDDYRCYCEHSYINELYNEYGDIIPTIENVQLAR
jgi:hypothetical protein